MSTMRVTLRVTFNDRLTNELLMPAFDYVADLRTYVAAGEHPEFKRTVAEEKAKVMYVARLVNKYLHENTPLAAALHNRDWRVNIVVMEIHY